MAASPPSATAPRRRATAVDVHTHIVPQAFPAYAGRHADVPWPQMQPCGCGRANVVIGGKVFRSVSGECWNLDRRLEAMERAGTTFQVLSPMPELLSYWLSAEDALALGRHVNDEMAGMVAHAPGHFAALGTVPLQDPDLAARELERLMRDGFRGVEIGTSIDGIAIGDPRFADFFATAEELGSAVFVHALHPIGQDRLVGPPKLANYVAFPCETAFAIASLMTGGILESYPRLRLAFSHGGGAFALVLPRLTHGWRTVPELAQAIGASPHEHARRCYYDTLVYDARTLHFLIETFGVTQLCIGTDYPFDIQERAPLERIVEAGLDEHDRRLLQADNALRFLGLC